MLTGHKMEKTGKHVGRGEGRLLLISCLCTETCFIKTLQPAVSLIFTDKPQGHKGRRRRAIFFYFCFYYSSLIANLGRAQQAVKVALHLFLLAPHIKLHNSAIRSSATCMDGYVYFYKCRSVWASIHSCGTVMDECFGVLFFFGETDPPWNKVLFQSAVVCCPYPQFRTLRSK